MEALRLRFVSLALLLLGACAASLDDEAIALLRFKEGVELDPYRALANWVDDGGGGGDALDPCSWHGVGCSRHRRVVDLNLKDLGLRGTLSSGLGDLLNLKSLNLHNNSFYGNLPCEIAKLQNLVVLDLGLNNLSGPLPYELDSISPLEVLILGGNDFLINLSPRLQEISFLSEPPHVDEGMEASHKGSIRMNVWDYAIRRLLKVVGQGIIGRRHKSESDHTRALVPQKTAFPPASAPPGRGRRHAPVAPPAHSPAISPSPAKLPPLPASPAPAHSHSTFTPSPSAVPSPSETVSNKKREISWIIYASIAVGIAALLSVSAMYIFCWRDNKVVAVRPWATGLSGQLRKAFVTGVPALKRAEIQTACEDFSNIVGTLTDCTLYKGTLSSGVEIAVTSTLVTSTKDWSKQCEARFRKKIEMLSKVNHKNFTNLLGYCEEEEPFTRMMVFEYAPNGTLFEHLHAREAEHLDWPSRLRIAMGVAYCLEYMHQLNPPVILRDLGSSSIYITDDCAAKVSDIRFWTDEMEPEPRSLNSGSPDSAPAGTSEVVYKFGVLLLELISGRLPFAEDDGLLVMWASSYLSGKRLLGGIVDPTLKSYPQEELAALCGLVQSCTNSEAKERPTMAKVASELREITAMSPDGAFPKLSPLWWAELEISSSMVA